MGFNLNMENDTLEVHRRSLEVDTTLSGHYYIPLNECKVKIEKVHMVTGQKTCIEKKIIIHKLHHQFANPSTKNLKAIIKIAGALDEECYKLIEDIFKRGEVCQKFKKTPAQPMESLPLANKSWRQHPTRHQLYGHLPPITKTIQVRRTRHAGHCWRSRDELIRDVLLWTPTHGRAKAGRLARTYIQQLCEDMGCCPEDLPRAMNDREEWRERVRDIRVTSAT